MVWGFIFLVCGFGRECGKINNKFNIIFMKQYCYINGKIIPQKEASLSINDLGILRGYGVFDLLRTYNGAPFLMKEHLIRFRKSARLVNIKIPIAEKQIVRIITRLLAKNKNKDANIKMVLTGGMPGADSPTLFILVEKLVEPPASLYERGIKLVTFNHQREMPKAKTLNYATAFKLQDWRQQQRAYEILYISGGCVLEATTSNFFIIKKNKLITPKKNILIGITRNFVLKLARGKFLIEERDIDLKDLARAEEAFITATNKEILPVVKINNRKIGQGKVGRKTKELITLFREKSRSTSSN